MKHEKLIDITNKYRADGDVRLKDIELINDLDGVDPFDLPLQIIGKKIPGTNKREQVFLTTHGFKIDGKSYKGAYEYKEKRKILVKKVMTAGGDYCYE